MQRIVIDTNVLVSALIQRSYPYFILNYLQTGENTEWCISDEVLTEYTEVLGRPKFMKYPDFARNAEYLLFDIQRIAISYRTSTKLSIIKDIADNKFLELASAANADFIITGNTNDFTMAVFGGTKITTPKEYWENHLLT